MNFDMDNISPVFFAWHDSGEKPNRHSSDSYGERIVLHYEIEYIVSSRSGYIITDGIPIQTIPGTVFFRLPGMEVEGIGVYHSLFVEFELNSQKEKPELFQNLQPVYYNMSDKYVNIEYFQSLRLQQRGHAADIILWKSKMLQILSAFLRYGEEQPHSQLCKKEEKQLQPIRDAIQYVQLHYAERITLQDLAGCAGYSNYYFCKLFKSITNLTPMQYVVRYRIEQAEKRLLLSDRSAETIMVEAGFHNYGYFWRTFKDIYGISPQEYRNRYRNTGEADKDMTIKI